MPAPNVYKLGPGTMTVGATGTEVDFSCQLTACTVQADVNADDAVTVLCGDTVPGARTYDFHVSGTMYLDLATGGIVDYSWTHKGETVAFTFTPVDTEAAAVAGNLIVDPLPVGGDEAGANMTGDFDWAIVGTPTFTPAAAGVGVEQSSTYEPVGA
jgi:hypothetical protein